jgi:hypothetical protein
MIQLTRLLEPSDEMQAWRSLKEALSELQRATHGSGARMARWMWFATRTRERVIQQRLSRPLIMLILEGTKRVALDRPHASATIVAREGQILLVPPEVLLDMVNEPDPELGIYRAFCMELLSEVDERLQKRYPTLCVQRGLGGFEGDRPHLLHSALQALQHLASTLQMPGAHALLIAHRLEDLVLTLLLQHREQLEGARAASSTLPLDPALAVRTLVRRDPARTWEVEDVARARDEQRDAAPPARGRRRLVPEPPLEGAAGARQDAPALGALRRAGGRDRLRVRLGISLRRAVPPLGGRESIRVQGPSRAPCDRLAGEPRRSGVASSTRGVTCAFSNALPLPGAVRPSPLDDLLRGL